MAESKLSWVDLRDETTNKNLVSSGKDKKKQGKGRGTDSSRLSPGVSGGSSVGRIIRMGGKQAGHKEGSALKRRTVAKASGELDGQLWTECSKQRQDWWRDSPRGQIVASRRHTVRGEANKWVDLAGRFGVDLVWTAMYGIGWRV